MDSTQIQVLDGMTLAEAQAQASNIKNLDDPYEEEVRKLVLGDNYQPIVYSTPPRIVSSDGLRTNLEVSLERGRDFMEKATEATMAATPGESFIKGPNGKMYSTDDIASIMAIVESRAQTDPNFNAMKNAARQDPPPTDKESFMAWLWDHKIYVAAGVAGLFFAWWVYQNFIKDGSAEADMADAAAAFFTGM